VKILMLNYEFPPIGGGGGQAHRALLGPYARRADLHVDVLTSSPESGFRTERFADRVQIHRVGIRKKDLHLWRRTEVLEWLHKAGARHRSLVRSGGYDLVHAFFGFPTGWLCYRTCEQVPYILSLRGSDVPGQNARLKLDYQILGPLVFKPIWRKASALVACSEGLQSRALRFLPCARIEVIPNGVDLDRFHPAQDRSAPDSLRLLTVGRLSATKRVPLLVDMVGQLLAQGCRARLTVVGGGGLDLELRGLVKARGLEDAVTFTGRREAEDMPRIYREHDVFVSASMQEGMSNAMLEAMASGLPIVTTRCEGVDELISDNGLVVDQPDPGPLADAVRGLAHDRAGLAALSTAARRKAGSFSWTAVAESYLRLYARVT